jgi:hypothetical protein
MPRFLRLLGVIRSRLSSLGFTNFMFAIPFTFNYPVPLI